MAKRKKSQTPVSVPPEPVERRSYTDDDVARVFALYNLYHNQAQVSRETGIPAPTINRWITGTDAERRKALMGNFDQRVQATQDKLMKAMGFVAGEALQQVHRKINDASAAQAATIYGILFDKQRLAMENLSGSSTGNTFIINGMSGDDTMQLLQRVLERQKQRQVIDIDAQVVDQDSLSTNTTPEVYESGDNVQSGQETDQQADGEAETGTESG